MNEKKLRILSIVLAFFVLLGLLPVTGLFAYTPPPGAPTTTEPPITLPPSITTAPPATLPPITSDPIEVEPLPTYDPRDILSFDMEGELPSYADSLALNAEPLFTALEANGGKLLSLTAKRTAEGAFWQMPALAFTFLGDEHAKADENAFALELTFARSLAPIPLSLSLSVSSNMKNAESGETNSQALFTLAEDGTLSFVDSPLGSVTSEALAVSVLFSYVPERALYLADVFVNARLLYTDLPFATLAEVSARSLAETEEVGISGLTVSSRAIYADVADGSLTDGEMTVTPTHYSAFGEDGNLLFATLLDDLYLTKGSARPKTAENTSTLVLYTGGKPLPGFLSALNDPRTVSARVSPSGDTVALPNIAGGWRSALGTSSVTEVSRSLLSGVGYAAYSPLPDTLLYENDFSTDIEGILLSGNAALGSGSLLLGCGSGAVYMLGNDYSAGYDPIATLTLSLSLSRPAQESPALRLALAGAGASTPTLLTVAHEGLRLSDGTLLPTLADGDELALSVRLLFDRRGLTVSVYGNGKFLGENTVAEHGLTLNKRLPSDLDRILLTCEDGDAEEELSLSELKLSRGSDTPIFSPLPDASLRLGADEFEIGLRFTFAVNRLWYEALISDDETVVGALILPTDSVPEGLELTHEALTLAGIAYTELTTDSFGIASTPYTYIYNASLIHVQSQNLARSFTAIGYLRIGDDYYYSTPADNRSLIEEVYEMIASGDLAEANEEIVRRVLAYAHSVILLDSMLTPIAIPNYDFPYLVSHEDGKLVIRVRDGAAPSLEDVHALAIGEKIYTAGWQIADGALTAPYRLPD